MGKRKGQSRVGRVYCMGDVVIGPNSALVMYVVVAVLVNVLVVYSTTYITSTGNATYITSSALKEGHQTVGGIWESLTYVPSFRKSLNARWPSFSSVRCRCCVSTRPFSTIKRGRHTRPPSLAMYTRPSVV